MTRLVLVLGDQLSENLSALAASDPAKDLVVMAEVMAEGTYVPHHPKKIALILAAMRKFATRLRRAGWTVLYTTLDDPENTHSIVGELVRRAAEAKVSEVVVTEPGEFRLIADLQAAPLNIVTLEDDRFVARHADFNRWAEGRKALRMEYFYREMRRKTGLLMDGDEPAGGKWNFDHDNRKPPPDGVTTQPLAFEPDDVVREVLEMVRARFGDHFGALDPFWFATDADQAQRAFEHFIETGLAQFGDYQDAMLKEQQFLFHSVISAYINIGLLDPLRVCKEVEQAWQRGAVPINAAEGFIRQVIGWREYMRGIYFHEGADYPTRNHLGHDRALPAFFWGAPTQMLCISKTVEQTRTQAYAHHIQRLMVTGNFALLAGINPQELSDWYLAVYFDAFEWVEAPNVIGMSQFADGGIIASKPYVSSGAYIHRMSDYCKSCSYSVTQKTGEKACPFNVLYWHFLIRNRERFAKNPRMAQMYRTWDRMDTERRSIVLEDAERFLRKLDAGATV